MCSLRVLGGSVTNIYFANNMHACFGARGTRGEHSARAANDSRADCSTRTFRARGQRLARVLRRGEITPRAQPTIRTRIAVQGEHSARGARAAFGFETIWNSRQLIWIPLIKQCNHLDAKGSCPHQKGFSFIKEGLSE